MTTVTGKVVEGKVVVEGQALPEGAIVTVNIPDDEQISVTAAELSDLNEAIAQLDRGEGVPFDTVLARLDRIARGT